MKLFLPIRPGGICAAAVGLSLVGLFLSAAMARHMPPTQSMFQALMSQADKGDAPALHALLGRLADSPLLKTSDLASLKGRQLARAARQAMDIDWLAADSDLWNDAYNRARMHALQLKHPAQYQRILQTGSLLEKAQWGCPGAMAKLEYASTHSQPSPHRSGWLGGNTVYHQSRSERAAQIAQLEIGQVLYLSPEFNALRKKSDAAYQKIVQSGTLPEKVRWGVPGARKTLESMANQGDVKAELEMGGLAARWSTFGPGLSRQHWYRLAAKQGNAQGQYDLGRLEQGNWFHAIGWFKKSAAQGYAPAELKVAENYGFGYTRPRDLRLARLWYTKAAKQGDAAMAITAWNSLSTALALSKYHNNPTAEFRLEDRVARYWPLAGKFAAAKRWNTLDTLYDNMLCVARDYYHGTAVKQNYSQALLWSRRALAGPHSPTDSTWSDTYLPWADEILGDLYYFGRGVPQNYHRAAVCFAYAASEGNDYNSATRLGKLFLSGKGVPKNLIVGTALFTLGGRSGGVSTRRMMAATRTFARLVKFFKNHKAALLKMRKFRHQLGEAQGFSELFFKLLKPYL